MHQVQPAGSVPAAKPAVHLIGRAERGRRVDELPAHAAQFANPHCPLPRFVLVQPVAPEEKGRASRRALGSFFCLTP
jgi:hypothetical protein